MSNVRLNVSQSMGYEHYQLEHSKEYRNQFVGYKLLLKDGYRLISIASKRLKQVEKLVKVLTELKANNVRSDDRVCDFKRTVSISIELSKAKKNLKELTNFITYMRKDLLEIESEMFDMVLLGDKVLSTHQKIQLLGGGMRQAKEVIEFFQSSTIQADNIPLLLLALGHTEYQCNKQRTYGILECDYWETPVFIACRNEMNRRQIDYGTILAFINKHERKVFKN